MDYVADYLRVRPPATSPNDLLFLDARDPTKGINPTTLSKDFTEVLVAAEIAVGRSAEGDQGCSFYSLKRTFARRSAEAGMDVAELAAIMGHSPNSIPMLINCYYTPTRAHKLLAHAEARPADGLHDWRRRVPARERAAALTLFERESARRGADRPVGNLRRSIPPSAKRWSGEYRSVSANSSASVTGA
jgi:hypothetical protein